MTRTITLELPESLYASLTQRAEQQQSTPEQLILDSLATTLGNGAQSVDDDPLIRLAGCITSDITDIAERHHEYLGQALLDELRHGNENEP